MKKTVKIFALAALMIAAWALPMQRTQSYAESAHAYKAAYVCDSLTGTVVLAENAEKRLPIASMCKIMTLLISFEALERGNIGVDDSVCISKNAAGMGGSQVFLQAGDSYKVNELIKSIVVCSANDSCVAMAEHVCGSEQSFVDRMNARAEELGAENTLFANCTGLPKEPQYSCAKDVAQMLRELIRHEQYFSYAGIWLEDFHHPDGRVTQMTNTNRLIRSDIGCDGGKTGFTQEAGFCLAATAVRQDTRLIGVIIGADRSETRFRGMEQMFEDTFSAYQTEIIARAGECLPQKLTVRGSKLHEIDVFPQNTLSQFVKRGERQGVETAINLQECRAPICKGDIVGELVLYSNGMECGRTPLCAAEDAARMSWKDAYRESAANW